METVMVPVKILDSRIGGNWCNRFIYLCLLGIAVYFFCMDVSLYFHIQARRLGDSIVKKEEHHYTAFSDITIKLVMSDPANNYIYVPSAESFDEITHFSTNVRFMTADVISVIHIGVSLLSAKLVNMDSLALRRIGAALYELRTWLDALDGVVYRAHTKQKHNFNSQRFSFGYYVDAVADFISAAALCFAVLFYLRRNLPKRFIELLPWRKNASSENGAILPPSSPTKRTVTLKCVSFGVLLLLSSGTWDSYISIYHELLEGTTTNQAHQAAQLQIIQSTTGWIIMWSWRILNAHSFLEMFLIAIFVDKLWEFLNWIQYIGYSLLIILIVATQIHLQYVQSVMASFATTSQ